MDLDFDRQVVELSCAWGIETMRYLEKSFTLPTAGNCVTQEEWDRIWRANKAIVDSFITPPATQSEKRSADPVANGSILGIGQCPNCHCHFNSYSHQETCIEPGESD